MRFGSGMAAGAGVAAVFLTWLNFRTLPRHQRSSRIIISKLGRGGLTVLFLAGLLYFLLWWLAWTIPDFGWDGLHYHNPTIHNWALQGKVHWIEAGNSPWKTYIDSFWNGVPKSVELSGFIFLSLTSLPRLLNALNLPLVLLAVTALYSLSRSLGAPRKTALPYSVLFVTIPVVTAQCITTYVDTGVAAFYLCVFALTIPATRRLGQGIIPWSLLVPLGAAGGLSLGAKGPGFAVPILAAVFFWLAGRKGRLRIPRLAGFVALFLLLVCLMGGYWPLRAFIHTGSPLYPVGLKINDLTIFPGGWDYFPPPHTETQADWSQVHRIAVSWLNIETDWNRIYSTNYGGLGHIWLLGGLPAILICLATLFRSRRENMPDRLSLLILIGFCLPLFFFMPHNHNHKVRYTIWLMGLGLPCLAFLAGRIEKIKAKSKQIPVKLWLGLVVILSLGEGYYTFSRAVFRLNDYLAKEQEESFNFTRVATAAALPYQAGFRWKELSSSPFRYVFSGTDTVALGELTERHELLVGHLTQGEAYGKRKILFLDPEVAHDQSRIRNYIQDNDIRFIIYEAGSPPPPPLARVAVLREKAGSLFRILVFQPEAMNKDNS